MAIDVFQEHVVSLADASKQLPRVRNGKKIHVASLYRWITAGKRGPDSSIVRLESIRIGGTVCTSLEALQRFFNRLTGDQQLVSPPAVTQRQWNQRHERAMRELKEWGV